MKLRNWMLACVPLAALTLAGCDVDVNDTGEAPTVDVDPGRAPDVDVNPADIDVRTEEREVDVPNVDVDVDTERTRIRVPNVDIDVPNENENEPGGIDN